MIIPIRCFSCGKVRLPAMGREWNGSANVLRQVVADLWERYLQLLEENVTEG